MKKKNYKSKNKFIIAVNLFLIFALMTVAVYAWFASTAENTVDAYEVLVQSDSALELSFDKETWNGSLNLSELKNSNDESVLDTMKFVEVTSDGTGFFVPQLTQKTNYAEVNTSGQWTRATANEDYLEFTVYMRSKEQGLRVFLSSESNASPSSSVITGENCGNPSSYATGADTFSKDCIVGALRVGFTNASNQNYVWITNPEFHLNNTIGTNVYTMDTAATPSKYAANGTGAEGGNFYWNNPYEHYTYVNNGNYTTTPEVYSNHLDQLNDTITTVPDSNETLLATLNTKSDEYYVGQATFKVWIEGCDTEARRALVDGKFNLSLILDTFGPQQ